MKHAKKLLALNLALLLFLTVLLPVAGAAEAVAIQVEETVRGVGDGNTYVFTPEEDGIYSFDFRAVAVGSTSPVLNLYDLRDVKQENGGFFLLAGHTYELSVEGGGHWYPGSNSFTLTVKRRDAGLVEVADITVTELPVANYSEHREFSEGLAAVRSDVGWGFIDATGKEIIPCRKKFLEVKDFSEGLVAVMDRESYEWGFIDVTGEVVIPCVYASVKDFSEGLAAVQDRESHQWGYIDRTGKKVVPCTYASVKDFSEGLAVVQDAKTEKWGYIDRMGREVIPCQYDIAFTFSDGLAAVGMKNSDSYPGGLLSYSGYFYGYIDQTGKEVVPCKYGTAGDFSEGYTYVVRPGVESAPNSDWTGSIFLYRREYNTYYIMDKSGKTLLVENNMRHQVYSLSPFSDGFTRIHFNDSSGMSFIDGGYGYITTDGEEYSCWDTYDDAKDFSEGMAAVKPRWKSWGFINTAGVQVIPSEYSDARSFSGGLAAVKQSGKWGFINKKGETVVELQYNEVSDFSDGVAWAKKDDSYVLLATGNTSAPPIPTSGTASASTQTVDLDGKKVTFECYALKDAAGNDTNYIKLRDLAMHLNGTAAQFEVGWNGDVTITTKTAYTPNGSELSTPFSGNRTYQASVGATKVNGQTVQLSAFVLNDDAGGGYTYYQLRDLGKVLGFNVGWSAEKGIFLETDKPYDASN